MMRFCSTSFRVRLLFSEIRTRSLLLVLILASASCGDAARARLSPQNNEGAERAGSQAKVVHTPEPNASIPSASQKPQAPRADVSTSSLPSPYAAPARLGVIENKAIDESSGIVASRANPGLLWTHNDSGDPALLYLIDRAGKSRGVWRVPGVTPGDWEDIAAATDTATDRSYLYIGDIGDNAGRRNEIIVYRIPEPLSSADASASTPKRPHTTDLPDDFVLIYPEGARDAEALMVHPTTGDLYIVTKQALAPAEVYRAAAPLRDDKPNELELVATINIPSLTNGLITGGDISPDGRRLVLCDLLAAYEFTLPTSAKNFDEIWRTKPVVVNLGARKQGEAICYRLDGRALLTTSEGVPATLDEVEIKSR